MELKTLTDARRKRVVQIPVGANDKGEMQFAPLTVWHRPLTPLVDDELKAINDRIVALSKAENLEDSEGGKEELPKSKPALVARLFFLLTDWDVTEQGNPVKLTEDCLMGLEWEVLVAIQNAIFEPIFPKATT